MYVLFSNEGQKNNWGSYILLTCLATFIGLVIFYFIKASNQGDPEATNRVGVMYEQGIGVEKDLVKAFKYYHTSANMNSLSGMANFASCLLEGKGTDVNINLGLEWLNKSSEKGNGVASTTLASYYTNGKYVEQDYKKAKELLERGMEQKYGPAGLELSRFYKEGLGVEKDLEKAKELEELAPNIFIED